MIKVIKIDDKDVRFQANAAFIFVYRKHFGEDPIVALHKLDKTTKGFVNQEIEDWDTTIFYKIIWTLAKLADRNLLELEDWLYTFESFPVMDIFEQVADLITELVRTNISSKNLQALENKNN